MAAAAVAGWDVDKFFIDVEGGAEATVERFVSESCSDSFEESALALDDWLVCWGEDPIDAVTTEEDPP